MISLAGREDLTLDEVVEDLSSILEADPEKVSKRVQEILEEVFGGSLISTYRLLRIVVAFEEPRKAFASIYQHILVLGVGTTPFCINSLVGAVRQKVRDNGGQWLPVKEVHKLPWQLVDNRPGPSPWMSSESSYSGAPFSTVRSGADTDRDYAIAKGEGYWENVISGLET